jgi:hypothetical protein
MKCHRALANGVQSIALCNIAEAEVYYGDVHAPLHTRNMCLHHTCPACIIIIITVYLQHKQCKLLSEYSHVTGMVWGTPWGWLPTKTIAEWALRPGYNTRIAIINAFQTVGGHLHRMLPIMVAEACRQDR